MKALPTRFLLMASILCFAANANAQRDLPAVDASTAGRSFCFGFGEGVYQGYLANRNPNAKPTICFNNQSETRNEVLQKFLVWIKVNPRFNQDKAATTLMRFFAQSYPCK